MHPKTSTKTIAAWLDHHGLFVLSLFLLIFIPLYPKIPLLEAIPGYLVRVRLEDILVFLTGLVWLIQLLRKKIAWRTSFHFLIIAYALVGLLSLVVAAGLQQTIPLQFVHLSKSFLHYFRYLEYFSLFLFMYAGIKTKPQAQITLTAIVITLNLIFIYGLGQRYLQWPAFSTMNREYSKGQALILNSSDKLQATFGGHYDLAAWLVISLPFLIAWFLYSQARLMKLWLGLSTLFGFWLLWESGSKTALAASILTAIIPSWYLLTQKLGRVKSSLMVLATGLIFILGSLMSLWRWQKLTLYKLAPFLRPTTNSAPIDATFLLGNETWSLNARKYGLSMGIRLDTLWPQALAGFSLNPFTGKGYATLNKVGVDEFTEADGTDNNFLRVLGETGLLGFVTFFGLIILILRTLTLKLPSDSLNQTLTIGFIAATAGLFVNAFIIDVFAASKVAFTYWGLAGLTLKSYTLLNKKIIKQQEKARAEQVLKWLKKFWPVLIASAFLILLVHKRPFSEYSLIKSFALDPTQAKYVATTKCWSESQQLQSCVEQYQTGLGTIYSLYLLPFYLLYHEPAMFYFANLVLIMGSAILVDSLIRKFTHNTIVSFLVLTIIFTTPNFYTLATKSSPANLWLFLSLILANLLPKIKPHRISHLVKLLVLIVALVHLALVQYFIGMTGGILASWRDTYRPSNYVAIRRANRYLPTRIKAHQPPPILITAVKPILFDLYGQEGYQLQPLNLNKITAYQQLLAQNPDQELFITNANAKQDFENYKHQFGISLKEIDCRQACNYYQLLAERVEIPTQPQTLNHRLLDADNTDPNFIVISDQLVADIGAGLFTPDKRLLKQELINRKPDLIFITGDIKQERLKLYGPTFLQRLQPELNLPMIAIPSDYNSPKHTFSQPQFQRFAIGKNWFVTLDAASHHHSPAQNRFLYDTLLQLEKHPETKKVYFISADDQWLKPHPDNAYFWEDFPQALEKFKGKVEFEFIYPN